LSEVHSLWVNKMLKSREEARTLIRLAKALPIAVVTRLIQWLKDFGIPMGGVPVNIVIDSAAVGPDAAEFDKNRVAAQQEHMLTIWREFDNSVRTIVPLFETEVGAVPTLPRLCDAMFAEATAALRAPVRPPRQVGASP